MISESYVVSLFLHPPTGPVLALAERSTLSIPGTNFTTFWISIALATSTDLDTLIDGSYTKTENARPVSVSISVITGVFASIGSITLPTLLRTSSSTSLTIALVLRVIVTLEIPSEELVVILSIHFISFTSL